MRTTNISLQEQRKRRFLLAMPPIVFCFVTLLFRTLGGGQGEQAEASGKKGLSMKLPSAIIAADQSGDKMSFYDQARADSLKKQQLRKADPYSKRPGDSISTLSAALPGSDYGYGSSGPAVNEAKINQRLRQLQSVINKPQAVLPPAKDPVPTVADPLQNPAAAAEDPELRQMNGLLEKILEIQHPERVKPSTDHTETTIAVKKFRAVPAVIDGTQKIVQGTVICLKLTDTVTFGGQLFNKGQHIYGSGDLSNQRYTLKIKSIHVGYNFYPVDLTVFDQTDGLEGISVPEAVTGDALRDGANSGMQSLDVMSLEPSITTQLATAGINTAKGMFGKKIKRVKAKIKDGHTLLLRDNEEDKNSH